MGKNGSPPMRPETVIVPADVMLPGELTIPRIPRGLVVFAHGSGSSRFNPRNQRVAGHLQTNGFATLLFDLLARDEEAYNGRIGDVRLNVTLLADRLVAATDWLRARVRTYEMPLGYFGASTGAAAALIAASRRPELVRAVVSRGGRPDLAGNILRLVRAPTLLIVAGNDLPVLAVNRAAVGEIGASVKRLEVVPGARHLFEEVGTLDRVADLARGWFETYLADHADKPLSVHREVS